MLGLDSGRTHAIPCKSTSLCRNLHQDASGTDYKIQNQTLALAKHFPGSLWSSKDFMDVVNSNDNIVLLKDLTFSATDLEAALPTPTELDTVADKAVVPLPEVDTLTHTPKVSYASMALKLKRFKRRLMHLAIFNRQRLDLKFSMWSSFHCNYNQLIMKARIQLSVGIRSKITISSAGALSKVGLVRLGLGSCVTSWYRKERSDIIEGLDLQHSSSNRSDHRILLPATPLHIQAPVSSGVELSDSIYVPEPIDPISDTSNADALEISFHQDKELPTSENSPPLLRLEDIDLDAEFGQVATDLDEEVENIKSVRETNDDYHVQEIPLSENATSQRRLEDIDLDAEFGQGATDLDEEEEDIIPIRQRFDGHQDEEIPSIQHTTPQRSFEEIDLDAEFGQGATDLDEEVEDTNGVETHSDGGDSHPDPEVDRTTEEAEVGEVQLPSPFPVDYHDIGKHLRARYWFQPSCVAYVEQVTRSQWEKNLRLQIQANEYWSQVKLITDQEWFCRGCPNGFLPRRSLEEGHPNLAFRELLGLEPCSPVTVEQYENEEVPVPLKQDQSEQVNIPVHHYNILNSPVYDECQTPSAVSYCVAAMSTNKEPIKDGTTWKAVVSSQAAKWIDHCTLDENVSVPEELLREGTSVTALRNYLTGLPTIRYEPWGIWLSQHYNFDEERPVAITDTDRQILRNAWSAAKGYPGLQRPHFMDPADRDAIINDDGTARRSPSIKIKKEGLAEDSKKIGPSKLRHVMSVDDIEDDGGTPIDVTTSAEECSANDEVDFVEETPSEAETILDLNVEHDPSFHTGPRAFYDTDGYGEHETGEHEMDEYETSEYETEEEPLAPSSNLMIPEDASDEGSFSDAECPAIEDTDMLEETQSEAETILDLDVEHSPSSHTEPRAFFDTDEYGEYESFQEEPMPAPSKQITRDDTSPQGSIESAFGRITPAGHMHLIVKSALLSLIGDSSLVPSATESTECSETPAESYCQESTKIMAEPLENSDNQKAPNQSISLQDARDYTHQHTIKTGPSTIHHPNRKDILWTEVVEAVGYAAFALTSWIFWRCLP